MYRVGRCGDQAEHKLPVPPDCVDFLERIFTLDLVERLTPLQMAGQPFIVRPMRWSVHEDGEGEGEAVAGGAGCACGDGGGMDGGDDGGDDDGGDDDGESARDDFDGETDIVDVGDAC